VLGFSIAVTWQGGSSVLLAGIKDSILKDKELKRGRE
jgi:hypothetical protein